MWATLWSKVKAEPFMAATFAAVMTVGAGGGSQVVYWQNIQTPPSVVNTYEPFTARAKDIQGWASLADLQSRPRTTEFRNGEKFLIVRPEVCYSGKPSAGEPVVTRAFIGIGKNAGIIVSLPDKKPPTATQGCAPKFFEESIPTDLPDGPWMFHVGIYFYQNPLKPSIRIAHPDVTITVVK